MNWERMSRDDASDLARTWETLGREGILSEMETHPDKLQTYPKNYREMYFDIRDFYKDAVDSAGSREKYDLDLNFGLKLYDYLNKTHGMDAVSASDDDIWRYIQMRVVPGTVIDRWPLGDEGGSINDERFWKNPRRIWLKVLWWYIHLSLQNNSLQETKKILSGNNADTISQLVERSGVGYRVELYRAIMNRLYRSESKDRNLLRKVLKLNVVHCATIEPLLFDSGVDEYVEGLFAYFE